MAARKVKDRKIKNIIVFGKIHTLIQQDESRLGIYEGNYQGNMGYVLKSIKPLNPTI